MVYALVHYPNIDTWVVHQSRKRHDPEVNLFEPHITLMLPMPDYIGENKIVKHLQSVLNKQQPFPIHLEGFQKSWDDYLFLMVREGSGDIIDLHSRITWGDLRGVPACLLILSKVPLLSGFIRFHGTLRVV